MVKTTGQPIASVLKKGASVGFKVQLASIENGKPSDITASTAYKTSNPMVLKIVKGTITAVGKGKQPLLLHMDRIHTRLQ